MEMERYAHGTPSWVDLGTTDVSGARTFYGGLFGWSIEDLGEEAGGYSIATLRGKPVAGLGPAQNPGPPYWATYVAVDEADALPDLVKSNGGSVIVDPFDVLDVGRMAVFADPAGAIFSVWQARRHIGAEIVNEPGALSWNELLTADTEGAKAFYGAVFGWGEETHAVGPGSYTEWKLDGRSVGGMLPRPAEMPPQVPNHWAVYFAVADCEASVARIRELGGSVTMGPMTIEPGTFAVAADPQGASFHVIQLAEGRAS
jgi:predicted enzyme related to lactoylglutathione lyase